MELKEVDDIKTIKGESITSRLVWLDRFGGELLLAIDRLARDEGFSEESEQFAIEALRRFGRSQQAYGRASTLLQRPDITGRASQFCRLIRLELSGRIGDYS